MVEGTAIEEATTRTLGIVVDAVGEETGTIAAIIITAIAVDTEGHALLEIASIPAKPPFRWIQRLRLGNSWLAWLLELASSRIRLNPFPDRHPQTNHSNDLS